MKGLDCRTPLKEDAGDANLDASPARRWGRGPIPTRWPDAHIAALHRWPHSRPPIPSSGTTATVTAASVPGIVLEALPM